VSFSLILTPETAQRSSLGIEFSGPETCVLPKCALSTEGSRGQISETLKSALSGVLKPHVTPFGTSRFGIRHTLPKTFGRNLRYDAMKNLRQTRRTWLGSQYHGEVNKAADHWHAAACPSTRHAGAKRLVAKSVQSSQLPNHGLTGESGQD
jgi:hypothetical protein